MTTHLWDTIVIGGGAAGLSAAQMLGRSRRRTLVIDAGQPRNRFASHMHGILGHDGLDPAELLASGRRELERYDVEVREGWVETITDDGATLAVRSGDATEHARAIVLATGITDRLPDIPGLTERWGTTVAHCPYCHGWEVRDQRIGVLATSPLHAHLAFMVRQLSAHVTVFAHRPELVAPEERQRLAARGVAVIDSPIAAIEGDGAAISHVVTADGSRHELDAIFTGGVPEPHDSAVAALALERTDNNGISLISAASDGATSHPRVWAAGNVVSPMDSVPMAASAGAVAGARVNGFLVAEDVDLALQAGGEWRDVAPVEFWEQRYGATGPAWSGKVNATLADAVVGLAPGRALDLGCGEGADAIHLARAGWQAHGVDISMRAIERARAAASDAGVEVTFTSADLSQWEPDGTYDLVTASFFHSPVALDRTAILHRASAAVTPGGHLLVITHAAPPPWADPAHVRDHTFLDARQEADALGLDPAEWQEVRVELVERDATGPNGQPGHLTDGVVMLRRR